MNGTEVGVEPRRPGGKRILGPPSREKTMRIRDGAEGGSRTRTSFRTTDFKSAASAIPPPRHVVRGANSTKPFLVSLDHPIVRLIKLSRRCFRFGNSILCAVSTRDLLVQQSVWRDNQNTPIHESQHTCILQLFKNLPGFLPRCTD